MGDAADDAERRALTEHEEEGPMIDTEPSVESMTVAQLRSELQAENRSRREGATDGVYVAISTEGKRADLVPRVEQLRRTKHDPDVEPEPDPQPEAEPESEAPVEVEAEVVEEVDEAGEVATLAELERKEAQMMLVRREPAPPPTALPSAKEWEAAMSMAKELCVTDFVPRAYRDRPETVLAAILTGRELGIGPMQALRDIHMIDGRPALAAHLQLAMLRRGHGKARIEILESESTDKRAFIRARRVDTGEEAAVEWTLEEADRAGLTAKNNWRQYPADMLWSRCVGRLSRRLASDLIAGMPYTAEEVADFDLENEGESYRSFEKGTVRDQRQNQAGRTETPRSWAEIFAWAEPYGAELGWAVWCQDACQLLFSTRERRELKTDQLTTLGQKASGAVIALREDHPPEQVPPPSRLDVQAAWAKVMDGLALPGPEWRMSPEEEDRPTYAEAHGEPEPEMPVESDGSAEDTPDAEDGVPRDAEGKEIEWPTGDDTIPPR